jgi:molybdopterin/thiamine biosynthesis adenylyltransferase
MRLKRLDRQLRIEGWNQDALDNAKIGVIGDSDLLASHYLLSASALGINRLIVLAPSLNQTFVDMAKKLNPRLNLTHIQGFYTHPVLDEIFNGCNLIADLSHYGLANKLLLQKGYKDNIPIVRGFCHEQDDEQGFKVFTYMKGREWQELEHLVSPNNLPNDHFDDGVLDTIIAGMVLEETKSILMERQGSEDLIGYTRKKTDDSKNQPRTLVVGSGALGIFVGLGLAHLGFRHNTFMDPDIVEETNLNRQVFFYDAIGKGKAETLSRRLNHLYRTENRALKAYFDRETGIASYDIVFDCVDNFETRIVLSEKCKAHGKTLISGGTSANAGQVVIYRPGANGPTPSELLGLYDIVGKRNVDSFRRERASCRYQPDPSVIMTNQIIAGFMVDSFRILLNGQDPVNVFYDAKSDKKI